MRYSERYMLGTLLSIAMTIGIFGAVRVFQSQTKNATADKSVG
jgi:hypothetical protein